MTRILIIDDDVEMRQMLRRMLEREDFEVIDAENGKEGIERYRENPTDLIITDIIMPEKEGIETIIELKRDFPDVKIIAISGGGLTVSPDCVNLAKQLGAQCAFTKPFDRKEILAAIHELLANALVS